jgi:hypothetical protein
MTQQIATQISGKLQTAINNGIVTNNQLLAFHEQELLEHNDTLVQRIAQLNKNDYTIFTNFAEQTDEKLLTKLLTQTLPSNQYEMYVENETPFSIKREQFREITYFNTITLLNEFGDSANQKKKKGIYLVNDNLEIIKEIKPELKQTFQYVNGQLTLSQKI